MAPELAVKAIRVLEKAGVDFTVLADEPASGAQLDFLIGAAQEAKDQMAKAAAVINEYETIVADKQEDKKYLSLKWGKLYRPEEWIALEQFYEQMTGSFDIQTAAHFDYLKMICKTSLKMNQAIDCGDIEGFAKLQKAYDSLMKSAKFTAAQNKAESGEFVDSVGELVYLCEEQGFIPRFHTDEPNDIVDITLKDMQGYAYRLVTEEMGLGNMIEAALQQMQREEEKEEGDLDESDEFLNPELAPVLEDADYEDYYGELEAQQQQDEQNMNGDAE